MLVRFNNEDGTHGYEEIDFRETMPAAGNETVSIFLPLLIDRLHSTDQPLPF
jgi:hypothetical protein